MITNGADRRTSITAFEGVLQKRATPWDVITMHGQHTISCTITLAQLLDSTADTAKHEREV